MIQNGQSNDLPKSDCGERKKTKPFCKLGMSTC